MGNVSPFEFSNKQYILTMVFDGPPMLAIAILAASASLVCTPATKSLCSGGICQNTRVTTWAKTNEAQKTYSRCDKQGCDTYDAGYSHSGVYTNIEVSGRSLIAKIGPAKEFVEIAAMGTDVYVSYGRCK